MLLAEQPQPHRDDLRVIDLGQRGEQVKHLLLRDDAGAERKLKIHRASVVTNGRNDPENLVIAAQDGALRLEEVQLEGKRRMSAAEFLRGYSTPVRIA